MYVSGSLLRIRCPEEAEDAWADGFKVDHEGAAPQKRAWDAGTSPGVAGSGGWETRRSSCRRAGEGRSLSADGGSAGRRDAGARSRSACRGAEEPRAACRGDAVEQVRGAVRAAKAAVASGDEAPSHVL